MCQTKERGCSLCFNEAIVARRILMIMIMIMIMMMLIILMMIIMLTIEILFTINSRKKNCSVKTLVRIPFV